ncbi:MAG: AmmeMemoRadiSam system protein A [Mariprofundaceae bacterium]
MSRRGRILTGLARAAIAERLGIAWPAPDAAGEDWLQAPGASFVTLHERGYGMNGLRGCIGTLRAHRPLIDDVRANAVAAAFHDPRFSPLTAEAFDRIRIEVSLLSPPQPLPQADTEAEALARIVPGEDGVILEYGLHRATFLPQVWAELPDPVMFLAHLKHKAGLPGDFWSPDMRLFTYRVERFEEEE